LETFLSGESIEAVTVPGRFELPPIDDVSYFGFVDPSGGRGDAMTLSIVHRERSGKIIQDCIRAVFPPFRPQTAVKDFAKVLKSYGLTSVTGDRYSGSWCSSEFREEGIEYKNSELSKSDLYLEFLPVIMQGQVELLDHKRMTGELRNLERRTGQQKDNIDHPPGLHDDLSNAAAGSVYLAKQRNEGFFFSA
jgi:hypothetical protein